MIKAFKEEGIIKEGHFILSSGRHSNLYIDKDAIFRSQLFDKVVTKMSLLVDLLPLKFNTVFTGPAIAGAVLASAVYLRLRRRFVSLKFSFVYPEKIEGKMVFRRGYNDHLNSKKVIIIEDVITTGNSIMKTITSIEKCHGTVIGVACIWNRTNWKPLNRYFEVFSLINEEVKSWKPKECLLCKKRIPLTDPKS